MNKPVAILMVLIPLVCFVQQIQAQNRDPLVIINELYDAGGLDQMADEYVGALRLPEKR